MHIMHATVRYIEAALISLVSFMNHRTCKLDGPGQKAKSNQVQKPEKKELPQQEEREYYVHEKRKF